MNERPEKQVCFNVLCQPKTNQEVLKFSKLVKLPDGRKVVFCDRCLKLFNKKWYCDYCHQVYPDPSEDAIMDGDGKQWI